MLDLAKKQNVSRSYAFLVILTVFTFILSTLSVFAQINNNRFSVSLNSLDMGPCGGPNDAHSLVEVLAKNNTINNFEIAFDLPDGVFLIPGSEQITFQQGSSDFVLTAVDISDLNAPVFRLERPGNTNWQVADLVRFRFDKTASCDAVQFSYSGGLFKDAHTITYNDLNGAQTASDTDPTINSYNFLRAYLAIQNYNTVNADVGDHITRTLEVTNSGNGTIGSFVHNVNIGSDLGTYALSFNGTSLTPTIAGNTYTYNINFSQAPFAGNVGDGDGEFENETLLLEESFTVIGCENINLSHQPTWGCSATEICQVPEPFSGMVQIDTALPTLTVTKINNVGSTDLCLDTTYTAQIANTATNAISYDVEINTGFGYDTYVRTTTTQNGIWGNDFPNNTKSVSNFRFEGQPSFTPDRRLATNHAGVGNSLGSYFIPKDFFSTDPDGPGGLEDLDGDGFFDDLAAGASTDLLYDYANNPNSTACGTNGNEYVRTIQLITDAYGQNQCDAYTATARRRMNNPFLVRRGVITDTPSDVNNATPFSVGIQSRLDVGGTDLIQCNGVRMFSNDPNSRYTVTLNVPNGISLSGAPANFTQVDANTIVYSTTDLPASNILNLNVEFPLVLDCDVYSGPSDVPLSYTTRYECSCFARDIHCGTLTGIQAQCGGPCDGPAITSFVAERETAGYTDDTMTTKVVLDPLVHNLETYMAKDEMVIRADGIINNANPDNLFFDVTYSTLSAATGGADIINYLNGTITINDLSSGSQTTAITVAPTLITDSPNHYRLRFDLSGYTNIISPTYTYGEPSVPLGSPENDTVHLELHYEFEENFTDRTLFQLEDFRGEFFNTDLAGTRISCNILGDRAYYFKSRILPYDRASTTVTGCAANYIELLIQMLPNVGDQFPNEFRPPLIWNSSQIEIPVGAEFTGLVTSLDYPGTDPSTTNGGLIASVSGNIVTVTPGPSLREWDAAANHYPRIRIYFTAKTDAPPSSVVFWTSNYQEFAYANSPVVKSRSDAHTFNYLPPNYTLTTANPIVSGDSDTATFEATLCIDTSTPVDYNWVQINNESDFTVSRVYEKKGVDEDPIPFTQAGGATWVQLGSMTGSDCKQFYFEVDYTNCSNFDFTLENASSCTEYPSDFSTATYTNPLTLRLEPKEAALQIAILNEPASTVDICSNFNIDLELRNAGNGDLVSPYINFDIPGDATSLILNEITVEYPRNSGDVQVVSSNLVGNIVTINLSDHTAVAINNAITGSLNSATIDDQIALIQLDLSVQCNFISNTAITYTAYGNNSCGSAAAGNGSRLSTNPIVVTGADASYDAISTIDVPAGGLFAGCDTETITVETTIVGGPSSNLDYARIILPDGLAFDAASFVSNNTTYPVTYTSVETVDNHEEFIVTMPDGANNGANPSYSFDVTPKNTNTTCSPGTRIEVFNFVVTSALTCGSVSCGTTEIAAGNTFENVIISKAELVESSLSSNADYTTDGAGNYEYQVQFGVENTGTVDITDGFVYDVYCADATGTKTGSSIFNGSISQSIPAGNSISEDILFTTTNFCGDNATLIVEFVPSSTNCHCDVLSIPIVSEPELADLSLVHTVDTPNAYIGDSIVFTIEISNQGPFDAENIQIEDVVPVGFTIDTINDGGIATGNTISWPAFDLASGDTISYTFSATVNTPTGTTGEYTSTAQVVGVDEYDPDSTPNNYTGTPVEDDEDIASVNVLTADLTLTKTIAATSNSNPTIGETITFEVTLSNAGPDAANNIQVSDEVPAGLSVDVASISNGGTIANGTIIWDITSLGATANMTLSYDASVNLPTGVVDEFTNIAQVTASDEFDPNSLPNNYDPNRAIEDDEAVYITAIQTSDLELTNIFTPTSANPGDTVTVTVELFNNGPNDATNISIENIVPQGLTATNISNGGVQTGNTIIWSGINLPNGINTVLAYDATVNTPTNAIDEYLNTAQVTAVDQYDLDSTPNNDDGDQSEDDEANALLMPISADLSLTKSISASSNPNPNTGDNVSFEVTLTNSGPSEATNVIIEDIIPGGYTLGTVNNGGLLTGNTINWNLASVPVGTQTFTYNVTMNAPTGNTDEYRNIAQVVASDQFDPNSAPNNDDGDQSEDDEASFTVATPTVDIGITKTADKTISFFGDTVTFSITAVNNSSFEATNIGIEEILPPGFQLVSHAVDVGTYDEISSIWEISSLPATATATLQINVIVTETDGYTNIAQLAYLDQIDADMSNDQDQVTIVITQDECLTVYNEFSPNGDGVNEVFFIECIDQFPNNFLQVFNRWGTKVFEMRGYDNTWEGISTGRATINTDEKLPVGTYYYTLNPGDGETKAKAGWLYISR
ncbi:gliding motility-associated C-terminal domain-containing protein [bacterium]|nr:gliding motility-associated C-terminal domain-containing protein [bacterium]